MSSTLRCPRGRSTRTRSSTRPPSPTTATASESTAISRASTTARSGARCTSGDGRPGSPSDSPRSSTTKPASTRSPTSRRMPLRVRPVRSPSSLRDSGPSTCNARTSALEVGATDALAALSPVPHCPRTPSRVCASRAQTLVAAFLPRRARVNPTVTRAAEPSPTWFNPLVRGIAAAAATAVLAIGAAADVAAGRRRRPPPARPDSSPTPAGSTTATRATSRSSSVAAWPRSTATTTAAASSTSPAAAGRPRCTTTTARSAGRSDFTGLPSPVTDLTEVTGAYPLDVDSDGHTDLAVLRAGQDVILRGLGDCRFERADEALGIADTDTLTVAFSATWEEANELPTLAFGGYVAPDRGSCADGRLLRPAASGDGYAPPVALDAGLLHAVDAVQRLEPDRTARPAHVERPALLPRGQRAALAHRARRGAAPVHRGRRVAPAAALGDGHRQSTT